VYFLKIRRGWMRTAATLPRKTKQWKGYGGTSTFARLLCVVGSTDRGAGRGSLEVEALHQILDRKLDVLFKSRVVGTMVPISSCLHHRCWTHAKLVSCRWIYLGEVENCAHVRV